MAGHMIAIERRKHPREGVMKQLADVTYAVLRKHAIAEARTESIGSTRP